MTADLKERIASSFNDWFGNKMSQLMLAVQCPPKSEHEHLKYEMPIFLDDLLKRYVPYSSENVQAIEVLKAFVAQYPAVSLSERKKAGVMCERLLLLFGIERCCEPLEDK